MEYSKIVAVTGLSGLQELISSKNDGAIVRSLEDKSTRFVSSRVHNLSHLESIEIFTQRDNVNLVDVFQAMEKNNAPLPDEKDPAAVKGYFQKVYPELDTERVYYSDMKKMVRWFQLLKANHIEIKLSELPEEAPETEPIAPAPKAEKKKEAQPAKEKSAAKEKAPETKKASAKAKKVEKEDKKSAPAKKSATKKK